MILRRLFQYLLLALLTAFIAVFLLLPIGTVVKEGCDWRLFAEVFSNAVYRQGLWNSLEIALVTTGIVFVISLPLAVIYDRYDFPGKSWCNLLMMLPMILPPFVGALGFQKILGYYGVLNTALVRCGVPRVDFLGGAGCFWSVCLIEALHLYPVFYLNIVTALGNLDPSLDEAAANLGASKFKRFFMIKLPLIRPGILAGASLVLVWSFTELGTPLMFGYTRTTAVQIFNGLNELETNPLPYTLVVIMLVFSALLYLCAKLMLGRNSAATMPKAGMGSSAVKLKSWRKLLPGAAFLGVSLIAASPHLALMLCAFFRRYYDSLLPRNFTLDNFSGALSNQLVLPSINNSLRYSLLAMLLAVVIGVVTSLASVRWKLRFSGVADLLAMLPLAVPGMVVAFGYMGMATRYDWARSIFHPIENPLWLLGIAYAVRRIPYVVRSVSAGLEQTPEELENAGRNFGASPWKVLAKITLPLIAANILVGGLFAFSFSMLEVSDSLILAQKSEFFPITKALYELAQILGSGPGIACAFGVWAMLFLAATLAVASSILGRKIGAVFKM